MLLMNPRLKIAHISQLVGYQDEKYFSKVFKKTTGMSATIPHSDENAFVLTFGGLERRSIVSFAAANHTHF